MGDGVDSGAVGERVIIDGWLRDPDGLQNPEKAGYFGSERDGGMAEYTTTPVRNALDINSRLTDAELPAFSCSYSTADGMFSCSDVSAADTFLVPGAYGGVDGALVPLARRRDATVIALMSESKQIEVAALGPDRLLPRAPADLRAPLGDVRVTVVTDVVGGPYWRSLIDVLERGGRNTCSGAIARPMVELDLRTFCLRDLTFHGSTIIGLEVIPNLVGHMRSARLSLPWPRPTRCGSCVRPRLRSSPSSTPAT